MNEKEEFDKLKAKVLKYILYKKRTEAEVLQKFASEDLEMLEEVVLYLKEAGYINEQEYIEKSIREFVHLNTLSIEELKYKLLTKGVSKDALEEYIENHHEELTEFELQSAQKIVRKKQMVLEVEQIEQYLARKRYKRNIIKMAIEEIQE